MFYYSTSFPLTNSTQETDNPVPSDTVDRTQEGAASESDDVRPDVMQSEEGVEAGVEEGAEMSQGALEHTTLDDQAKEKVNTEKAFVSRDIYTVQLQ